MSKATEFSKNIQQEAKSPMDIKKMLNNINAHRSKHQFGSILSAQVSDTGDLDIISCITKDMVCHLVDAETALKFATWIIDTFTENRAELYSKIVESGTTDAPVIEEFNPSEDWKIKCFLSSIKQYAEDHSLTADQCGDIWDEGIVKCNATGKIKIPSYTKDSKGSFHLIEEDEKHVTFHMADENNTEGEIK